MKVRFLRKILNNTEYIISDHGEYIAVGSVLCHDLIKVEKTSLKLSFALDTFNKGRSSIKNPELEFIWDKLSELIKSGEIQAIINGYDEIETKIPVFYSTHERDIVESYTDELGWPNTTFDGQLMYDNYYFPTREQAVKDAFQCAKLSKTNLEERIQYLEKDLENLKKRLFRENAAIEKFSKELNLKGAIYE